MILILKTKTYFLLSSQKTIMVIHCLNCDHAYKGNFCPECGQKSDEKRITATVLLMDLLHFFTHLENGFLFTSWSYLVRPGKSALDYISGIRKKYQKPVSYFLIWTGLFILLHNYIIQYNQFHLDSDSLKSLEKMDEGNLFFRIHFTVFIIPVLLMSSLVIYFVLAKPKFNLIEILVSCLYGTGTYFMLSLFSDLIFGVLFHLNILSFNVFLWQTILSAVYNFWFTFDFFSRIEIKNLWIRLITTSILISILGWAMMIYLPLIWLYFFE